VLQNLLQVTNHHICVGLGVDVVALERVRGAGWGLSKSRVRAQVTEGEEEGFRSRVRMVQVFLPLSPYPQTGHQRNSLRRRNALARTTA
jgi:hypothetical protein